MLLTWRNALFQLLLYNYLCWLIVVAWALALSGRIFLFNIAFQKLVQKHIFAFFTRLFLNIWTDYCNNRCNITSRLKFWQTLKRITIFILAFAAHRSRTFVFYLFFAFFIFWINFYWNFQSRFLFVFKLLLRKMLLKVIVFKAFNMFFEMVQISICILTAHTFI